MDRMEKIRQKYTPKGDGITDDTLAIQVWPDMEHLFLRIKELESQLQAADEGMLRASDPNKLWQGIHAECLGWKNRAEEVESRLIQYGEHHPDCNNAPCKCGLKDLLEKITPQTG